MTTSTKRPDGGELMLLIDDLLKAERRNALQPRDTDALFARTQLYGQIELLVAGREGRDALEKAKRVVDARAASTPTNESPAPQADATANDIADALERSTQSMARECKVGMGLWNGHSNACLNAVALLRKASVSPAPQPPVEGLRELFRELIAYRENYRPTWATALPNLSWEQFDIILAALASPSLTAGRNEIQSSDGCALSSLPSGENELSVTTAYHPSDTATGTLIPQPKEIP